MNVFGKTRLVFCVIFSIGLLASLPVEAAQHGGKIVRIHLNNAVPGQGACIGMNPPVPTNGWACLWAQGNPLWALQHELLLQCYVSKKTVTITWNRFNGGQGIIEIVQCDG